MNLKGRKRDLLKLLLFCGIIGCLLLAGISNRITAQPQIDPSVVFVEFWSDYESVFLFYPQLVEQIFLDIVDLKGNRQKATRHIRKDVLACKVDSNTLSECRLDQLRLMRRQQQISDYIKVPVNITSISGKPYKKNKTQYVLTIRWQPLMFRPPEISVKDFYHYLGAADESEYYQVKKDLDQIQINPIFENKVSVIANKTEAINLLNLYRNPPADFKDTFLFQGDTVQMDRIHNTANFNFHLKAVRVKINHLTFQTTKELLL